MLFQNPNIIFLHIPKTAGNHFTNLFLNYSQDSKFIRDKEIQDGNDRFSICGPITKFKHHKIDFYNSSLNLGNFEIFFIYRDPLDRLLSAFFSPDRVLRYKKIGKTLDYSPKAFEKFIFNQPSTIDFITLPNLKYYICKFFSIYSLNLPNIKNIQYLRFNNLRRDILSFSKKFGFEIDIKLLQEHVNVSNHTVQKKEIISDKKINLIINKSFHKLDRKLLEKISLIN